MEYFVDENDDDYYGFPSSSQLSALHDIFWSFLPSVQHSLLLIRWSITELENDLISS